MAAYLPRKFGKYCLLQHIAVGGMAELFKAKVTGEAGFEKLVAIKRILPHLSEDQDLVTMFIDEAKLAALLSHQNIVQIYDFGKVDGIYFIAMEYLQGKDLGAVMKKAAETVAMPVEYALYIASRICAGLDYSHNLRDLNGAPLNIIHRDISPQNILITYPGGVKIVDFGIAKAASSSSYTRVGVLKGKVAYMSPEQAAGKPIDKRSDIFSTGVLLYEMISGDKLFLGDTIQVLDKVRNGEFEPLERVTPGLPANVYSVVRHALASDPADRYQSCGEMLFELDSCLAHLFARQSSEKLSRYVHELFAEDLAKEAGSAGRDTDAGVVIQKPVKETEFYERTGTILDSKRTIKVGPTRFRRDTGEINWMRIMGIVAVAPIVLVIVALTAFLMRDTPSPAEKRRKTEAVAPQQKLVHQEDAAKVVVSSSGAEPAKKEEPVKAAREGAQKPAEDADPDKVGEAIEAVRKGDFDKALALFENVFVQKPEVLREVSAHYAGALLGKGMELVSVNPENARQYFEKSAKIDPGNGRAFYELGKLCTNLNAYDDAIQAYHRAAAVDPRSADIYYNLGYVYARIKDYESAEDMFRRAIDLSPAYLDEIYFNLAMVQKGQGKLQESVKSLEQTISINPENKNALRYLERFRAESRGGAPK